ncbi:hypothetical protein WN51_07438 [Melipona quadrifasciata]|uniref:Uncharacterized protein n=1 Tax=Melipona quadrifasciata TaxID=166423 RepID=A0A0M9A740_9HYME|nr:hypothetical protein WN51_07438 [Melipona quadrifasciata]
MDNDFLNWIENKTTQEGISPTDQLTSYALLKKKVAATHELIKKYNDKLKEGERLKQELDTLNKRMKEVTCNYNSSLAKVIKLELQNTEYKKKIETLTAQVNEVNIKTAADQQHIQQLICKIKDVEGNQNDKIIQYDLEKSSLQVRVKELEQELKNTKKSYETKIKKVGKKISIETENKEKLKDAGTNTTLTKDMVMQKPEITDKSVLTLEFYDTKDNPYPIFCNKCKILLDPPPINEICKVLSDSCPKIIKRISSPSRNLSSALEESIHVNNEHQCKAKSLSTLKDISSQQSNQNNLICIPTNPLSPYTIPSNHINCNTFPSTSNLINQGNNHIYSVPINPSSMVNSNTTNENKNCESLITMATSSISLISSLEKKIYALETKAKKMKKKLNKKHPNRNNTCKKHHQNVSMYDINNFMQTNFNDLWRKMKDICEGKERKNLNAHKRLKKLSRLKRFSPFSNSNDMDVNETEVEIVENFVQCSKSMEVDLEVSSECESNKSMQLKETTDTSSELTEQKNTIETNSSIENEPCFSGHGKLVNKSMTKVVHASHLIKLKIVKTCQNMLNQDISDDEHEDSNISENQKNNNPEVVTEDHYISKRKPRIAHTPKTPIIKRMKLNNFKTQLVNDLENNSTNEVNLNKSKDQICSNKIEKPQLIFSHSDNTENVVENPVREIPISNNLLNNSENKTHGQDINTTFETNTNKYNQFDFSVSNINSVNETTEQDETKTDSNKKRVDESNFLHVREISKTDDTSEQKLLNFNDMSFTNTSNIHNINEWNLNTEEITHNNVCTKQENSATELESHCPLKMLQEYINKKPRRRNIKIYRKKLLHARQIADQFVNKQLERLINSDWQSSIHWDVIEKLKSTCNDRIIAKGIVEFLSIERECNKTLDNSYTPPAPLMTKAQQRIAPLLIDLEKSKPMVFQFVEAGITYKLFKLNQTIERCVIESLARMYTILARIKKDREKVRIFCCDALYCLGFHAILILYTVLTCWPEVFPNNETSVNRLLPKCMAHLIVTQQGTDYPKVQALKNLISLFYKYPLGTLSKDILQELLIALQERCDGEVEAAIILLAKREGTAWTYTNIIRGALLSMIINNKLPSMYRALSLLGNLLRVFPVEDKDNSVGEIVEQLCDLINSDEGSNEQKEGIISALLSLSRHKFDQVVQNTLKWTPSVLLCDRTIEQINGLFDTHDSDFWSAYLKKHRQLFLAQEKSKT